MKRTILPLFLSILATLDQASAQVLYGSVVGAVLDPSEAAVPNATVQLISKETGLSRDGKSDSNGRYSFVNVLPGAYSLRVTAGGFRAVTREELAVVINTVARADVRLQVGDVTEQITVSGAATALQTEKADVRTEFNRKEISTLPLASYRNFQSLFNLVPGATPANFQNSTGSTPARALSTNINGTARNNNNTRVDGATNVYIWLPHHMVYVPPVESIETVNLSSGSFDAEQGMAGGSSITVATKSGTNEWHGSAFHFHDNQRLRTRNFFLPAGRPIPKSIFNIFGATFGGKIIRDKLFFFSSMEGTLERAGITRITDAVPTAAIRAGNFAGLPTTLFDPLTGNDGNNRTAFPGNVIPASRLHPISRRIQDLAPLPNQTGASFGTLQNFFSAGTESLNRYNYDLKINYNPRSDLSLWGKYSRMDASVASKFAFGDIGGPGLSRAGAPEVAPMTVNIYTFGFNKTFSPTFLVDGTLAINRMDTNGVFPGFGKNIGTDLWGIPNTNDPVVSGPGADRIKSACPAQAGGACYSGMPSINHGFTTWGNTAGWQPYFYGERTYNLSTNFTKIRGGHEFRWGFDTVRYHMDQWQPEVSGGPRGSISFDGNVTGQRGYTPNYLNQYATYLLGLTTTMQKAVQFLQYTNREWQFGFYARDRWQVNRKLTVNIGVRWEYFPLITRADRGLERWDPATNLVYMGGIGNVPRNTGMGTRKDLFAPRLGIAYRMNEKTVIRTGYGLTYDPLPFSRPLRGMYPSTIGASFVSASPFQWIDTLDKGIPPIPLPDISTGVFPLPPTVDMGPRSPWGGTLNRGYIQSWNFTIERRLPADFVGSLAYVGTQTTNQLADRDINAAAPGAGPAGRPLAVTQNRRIAALMWDGWLSSNYHSMQATMNRQFRNGLFWKSAYTWSKAINMTDEDGWTGALPWGWDPVVRRNRAVAGYDRTHMFTTGFFYELPFGPNKRFLQTGPVAQLLRGWQTNGLYTAYTGTPFTVGADGGVLNAPGNAQTADQVKPGKVRVVGEIGPNRQWFDASAFRQPTGVRFGSTGRNTMRGPGMWNFDLSLFRNFALTERIKMEFKAEAFNVTNTPKFSNPGASVQSMRLNPDGSILDLGNFSSITSTLPNLGSASERQFRFGLRLSF
jgi:hypothetical protein